MSTLASELQEKIRSHIPLSENMQLEIVELDEGSIHVHAPLAPNINIHGTGFAGSIYSLAVLTGWAMVSHIMELKGIEGDLVVGKAEIKYRLPVESDIDCYCRVSDKDVDEMVHQFAQSGKGRLTLDIVVGDQAAVLSAIYVVVGE